MNIYISKEYTNVFLENLKEIPIIDDYNIDRERLGKEKIKLHSESPTTDVFSELIKIMPVDSMIVDQIEYPGSQYILCVGEINVTNFVELTKLGLEFSILTMKDTHLRFNAWVRLDKLNQLYSLNQVSKLSSINGAIEEYTFFVIEAADGSINEIHKVIAEFTNEYIIKGKEVYAKILLQDFSKVFHKIADLYLKIDIIDANEN